MAKKQHFLTIDGETSIKDRIVDFGAAITDRNGNVITHCAVLVNGVFGNEPLFHDVNATGIWARANLQARTDKYTEMLNQGSRVLASVGAINRWLEKAAATYSPTLTAYNLAFDVSKCHNTGIDLNLFPNRFCLWHAAAGNICQGKPYRRFVMENHLFNTPTGRGNMTYRTDAEAVTGFLNGQMQDEPHTAIEDILGFEIPILVTILKKRNWRDNVVPYNWVKFQVKNHFTVK